MGISTVRLILSVSKYSRYIFSGRNAQFSIGTKQDKVQADLCDITRTCVVNKRIELNACENFQHFTNKSLLKYLEENICYLKSLISPWRGLQWKSLWSPSTPKNQLSLRLLLAFPNVWLNIFKYCFLNICCNSVGTNSGSYPCQSNLIWTNVSFFAEK